MTDIGLTIKQRRVRNGYTQEDAAAYVSDYSGKAISRKAVHNWEKGITSPNARQFLLLCKFYKVDDVLGTFGLSGALAALSADGRARVKEYTDILVASGMFRVQPVATIRKLPLFDLPASAVTGEFLDGESYDLVEIEDTVSGDADFGIRLAGNSMEPRFTDGQIVWVQRTPKLQNGDVGIFSLNGQAYCKKLNTTGPVRLVSLNPTYEPIVVHEGDELRAFGKVVG